MSATPLQFVEHWFAVARVARPRWVPDGWLRQAGALMEKGVTLDDLTLVARWMREQQRRSNNNERGAVAFNDGSFQWKVMFGDFGASDQHETFLSRIALAEAARRPAAQPVQPVRGAAAAGPASEEERARLRAKAAEAMREFQQRMQGGPGDE